MIEVYIRLAFVFSILLSYFLGQVNAADTAADSRKVKIQRSFVNLSFSEPTLTGTTPQLSEAQVPGWMTTHPNPKLIEMWRGKGAAAASYTSWSTVNTYPMNQYAELNAEAKSALYQNVCLFQGEEFTWNFRHAARSSLAEQASFYIGRVSSDRFSFSQDQLIGRSQSPTRLFEWKDANPSRAVVKVSVNSGIYQFIFDATAYGRDATLGNLLDDIELNLKPAVEFSAESSTVYEGNDSNGQTHTVPFNIVGFIKNQATMPTLKFKIEYPSNYTKTKAIYGTNYRLYKQTASGLVELTSATDLLNTSNPDQITFNYTPIYNSSLDYSEGVEVNGLVIKVYGNTPTNPDIEIPFSFALDASSKAIATSLSVCGDVTADVDFNFKIQEDDVDLSVVKSSLADTIVAKGSLISYILNVANNTNVQADGVILRDTFKNLARITTGDKVEQTALVCEDLTDGNSKACPASWTDSSALNALLSGTDGTGLNLGTLPANAKYKFTVKNLKVVDTDTSSAGYSENMAVIESTKMYDIDSNNNRSTVKTMHAAKNDLYNNDSENTGKTPFMVNNAGNPLWVQSVDEESKVYFPLIIKNEAAIVQDYQLYTSSVEIKATQNMPIDYASLDKTTISPFTSGLKIEFYKSEAGLCDANIKSQQITQLNVAANTSEQICAVVTVLPSAQATTNIWFAIESLQSGFGDVILDAVTSIHLQHRLLELVNDQSAQINIGGTYVFLHHLLNHGNMEEKDVKFRLTPVQTDDFLYTLFEDVNKNGVLDAADTMIVDQSFSILANAELALLIKVQASATALNGMSNQVKLEAIPNNDGQTTILAILANLDNITVGSNQLKIKKEQFKQIGCVAVAKEDVKSAMYTVQTETLGLSDCLIYRITVTNIGDSNLSNVLVSDMYPAYTIPWKSGSVLPMTNSVEAVQEDGIKLNTIFLNLEPREEKSLYFGIKMQ